MSIFKRKRIFLDHAGGKSNPSGIHKEGVQARSRLENMRSDISRLLHCQSRDIVFTSGGTESDNLAMLGVFEALRQTHNKPHIIISDNEHPALFESAKEAERRGAELSILPVGKIAESIKENTVLVSVVYVSNETGAINPVPKISRLIKDYRKKHSSLFPYFHTDATQAVGYLPVDIERLGSDLMTLGDILVVRSRVDIRPLILGGGQERGLRAGTQNLKSIEETFRFLEQSEINRENEFKKALGLKKAFLEELEARIPNAVVNSPKESVPNIISITLPNVLHEFIAIKLDERGVATSTGTSCDSSKNEKDKEALRFSFGSETTEKDVREAVRILSEVVI
ncbi:MAG: cysteine desulfurase family protein [Minisyncoccota bacterium]